MFLTGIKIKGKSLFTSSLEEKCVFSNMPVQFIAGSYGGLFLWQYVNNTVIKHYNKREQRKHWNSKTTETPAKEESGYRGTTPQTTET